MTRRDALFAAMAAPVYAAGVRARVQLRRLPPGGIQPQAVGDAAEALHVLYYSGDAGKGDIFYSWSKDGGSTLSPALRVNSAGSAVAAGTIRGAQMAVGRGGRVHVAWNGSAAAKAKSPADPRSGKAGASMLYSRLNDDGTAFEPERGLMRRSYELDGGGSVAADNAGNVYVVWHGADVSGKHESGADEEASRAVWVAKSADDGRTFGAESTAWGERTGACGCCGLKAFASRSGLVHILYRSAREAVHRDVYLIRSNDQGKSFAGGLLHAWEINACPMSSMDVSENAGFVAGAWETGGQVYWACFDGKRPEPIQAPGAGKGRKHPRIAINAAGETLLVWTEGTAWQRGGSLAWQLYDRGGRPTSVKGVAPGIPTWSFAAPAANFDGSFSILY